MAMKKWMLFILTSLLCLNIIACIHQRNNTQLSSYSHNYNFNSYNYDYNFNFNYFGKNAPAVKYTKTYVIGLAMADTTLPYYTSLIDCAKNESDKLGMELLVADAGGDVQNQINQISGFIKQKVDLIILMPVDSSLLTSSAKKIKESNIPLINLNNKLDDQVMDLVDSYIGINGAEQGELAAELMLDALPGVGGNIVIIDEKLNLNNYNAKIQGFINRMSQVKNVKIIAIENSFPDSGQIVYAIRKLLNEYSDIDGIFIFDDNMITACIQAVELSGRSEQIRIVAIGGSKAAYKAIEEGLVYGTVAQAPDWEGIQIINCAYDILGGKKVKVWYRAPSFKITLENVEKYKELW